MDTERCFEQRCEIRPEVVEELRRLVSNQRTDFANSQDIALLVRHRKIFLYESLCHTAMVIKTTTCGQRDILMKRHDALRYLSILCG